MASGDNQTGTSTQTSATDDTIVVTAERPIGSGIVIAPENFDSFVNSMMTNRMGGSIQLEQAQQMARAITMFTAGARNLHDVIIPEFNDAAEKLREVNARRRSKSAERAQAQADYNVALESLEDMSRSMSVHMPALLWGVPPMTDTEKAAMASLATAAEKEKFVNDRNTAYFLPFYNHYDLLYSQSANGKPIYLIDPDVDTAAYPTGEFVPSGVAGLASREKPKPVDRRTTASR